MKHVHFWATSFRGGSPPIVMPHTIRRHAMTDFNWRFRIPLDRLDSIRHEAPFVQMVALGRALNSLRFLQLAFLQYDDSDHPPASRQRFAAVFFMAAVLHEGIKLLKRMGQHFRTTRTWQESITPIFRDRLVERLFDDSIAPLRTGVVFHFMEKSVQSVLAQSIFDEIVLISGAGPQQGNVHYDFSDLLAFVLFTGVTTSADEHLANAKTLLTRTLDVLTQFIEAAESLATEYCVNEGFLREVRDANGNWYAA